MAPSMALSVRPGRRERGQKRGGVRWWRVTVLLAGAAGCSENATAPRPDGPPVRAPCVVPGPACRERLALGAGRYLPVYRTHPLAGDGGVERAVVVVHGTDRNGDTYFGTMVDALAGAGELPRTVVVAPDFQTQDDGPAPDEPFWSSEGWKRGDLSSSASSLARISSFAAVDTLLSVLSDQHRFPGLKSIVLTGHSAGGQFTHRFAGASPATERTGAIAVRFVVVNPSTYLWLGPERPFDGAFAIPDGAACPGWNDWPYGLTARNSYASAAGDATIRVRLSTRDVRILVGDADTLTASLDMSCGADLQGRRRYDRGRNMVRFMDRFYPGHGHREGLVPGVGHSSSGMYRSSPGITALTSW